LLKKRKKRVDAPGVSKMGWSGEGVSNKGGEGGGVGRKGIFLPHPFPLLPIFSHSLALARLPAAVGIGARARESAGS